MCCATLEGHESTVWSVAFDGSGERLASCSDDKTVRIWQRYKPGNEEGELPPCCGFEHEWFSPSCPAARSASPPGLQGWRAAAPTPPGNASATSQATTAGPSTTCRGERAAAGSCSLLSQDSGAISRRLPSRCRLTGALATACGDDAIRVFEESSSSSPQQQPTFSLTAHVPRAHSQDVNCVAWNPKEPGLLASCSDDGEIAFWQYQQPEAC